MARKSNADAGQERDLQSNDRTIDGRPTSSLRNSRKVGLRGMLNYRMLHPADLSRCHDFVMICLLGCSPVVGSGAQCVWVKYGRPAGCFLVSEWFPDQNLNSSPVMSK